MSDEKNRISVTEKEAEFPNLPSDNDNNAFTNEKENKQDLELTVREDNLPVTLSHEVDFNEGLTDEMVAQRVAEGKVNTNTNVPTKSIAQIIKEKSLTLFNILNLALAIMLCAVGQFGECKFMGVVIINLAIGIIQEVRAKKVIDKLSVLSAPKALVVRNGEEKELVTEQIVIDDIVVLEAGRQIVADCKVISGTAEVDESLVTGESDAVVKNEGDELLSGSYVVSGKVYARVIRVGQESYASKIQNGAKVIKTGNSQIYNSLKGVIRIQSFIVIPLGILLFCSQKFMMQQNLSDSVVSMVATMISMIPQGLVALSSVVFAVSIIRLSARKTLAQDLYCIETLARVDVLCLDKTGTITEGCMEIDNIVPVAGVKKEEIIEVIRKLIGVLPDKNPTALALKSAYQPLSEEIEATEVVPFSSKRKWSGASFGNISYAMGALQFMLKGDLMPYIEDVNRFADQGSRVLTVLKCKGEIIDSVLPEEKEVMGYIIIKDKIREEAARTLKYFHDEGVDIRVISGDDAITVSRVAERAGLANWSRAVNASTFSSIEELTENVDNYTVFGRVTPDQKLALVKALKAKGHTVAMTGDGVNDVLALKEADCSIAMASGSDAARTVSHIVLLDNNFASMPEIVLEGRRSINNLQRTASLYLVKTLYSALLAILFILVGFAQLPYPFNPSNLTLIGGVAIGIPSFLLALEPNHKRVQGRFIYNAMKKALPGSITIVISIIVAIIVQSFVGLPLEDYATVSFLVLSMGSFLVLIQVCVPFSFKRVCLVIGMIACYVLAWLILPQFFSLPSIKSIDKEIMIIAFPIMAASVPLMFLVSFIVKKYSEKRQLRFVKLLKLD